MSKVNFIPEGYTAITPYLIVDNASAAIEFYKKAFGAKEVVRMPGPDGRIGHAELQFGGAYIMLADENPQMNHKSAKSYGGSPVGILLYVENVDAVVAQALAAGATIERPIADQFYGDRSGGVVDPFGYRWYVSTHIKDVTPAEMKEAMAAMATAG
jgi:PhnB protein